MSDLPPGWRTVPMGEVCKVVGGSTPKTSVEDYWGGDIPWVTPNDLSGHVGKYLSHGERSITEAGYQSCSTTLMPAGSVLFSSRAPIGYTAIAANPVCTNQGFKSFVPSDVVRSDYLYWYLRFAAFDINKMGSGTTFSEISGKVAKTIPLILAPLEEQQGIVEAIEEQFSRLDAAVGSLRRVKRNLSRMRASTLKAAVEGSLTGSESAPGVLADGWVMASPNDLAAPEPNALAIGPFGSDLKVSDYTTSGVPLVFVRNIRRRQFDGEHTKYVTPAKAAELQSHQVEPGDLLITKMGDPPGDAAIYSGVGPAVITADCIKLRPRPGVDARYLDIAFNSPVARSQILRITRGVAQKKVSLGRFRNEMHVPLPPPDEQASIVSEVDRRLSVIAVLEATVNDGLARAKALRRSILHETFAGRLTRVREPAGAG